MISPLKIDPHRLTVDDLSVNQFFGTKVDHLDAIAFATVLFGHSFDRYFKHGCLRYDLDDVSATNNRGRFDLIHSQDATGSDTSVGAAPDGLVDTNDHVGRHPGQVHAFKSNIVLIDGLILSQGFDRYDHIAPHLYSRRHSNSFGPLPIDQYVNGEWHGTNPIRMFRSHNLKADPSRRYLKGMFEPDLFYVHLFRIPGGVAVDKPLDRIAYGSGVDGLRLLRRPSGHRCAPAHCER